MCTNITRNAYASKLAILLFGQLRTGFHNWKQNKMIFSEIESNVFSSLWIPPKNEYCSCFDKTMQPTASIWLPKVNLNAAATNIKIHGHVQEMYYTIKAGMKIVLPFDWQFIIFTRTDASIKQIPHQLPYNDNVIVFGAKGWQFKDGYSCGPNPTDTFFYTSKQTSKIIASIYDNIYGLRKKIETHPNYISWKKLGRKILTKDVVIDNAEGFLTMQIRLFNVSCKIFNIDYSILRSQESMWYHQNKEYEKMC